jgi:LDH2 family malate/lactate/ureidoglycolate dehydrogenase
MFSTNPLSFAAPCGRHPSFVLDMSTSVTTVNRVEMHAQEGREIPAGWARDAAGNPTTDPNMACALSPLGVTAELGAFKGAGLGMMVTILSGILSGSWFPIEATRESAAANASKPVEYDQPTMGHVFAALKIDAFQPLDQFRAAMDAMIEALHAAPPARPGDKVCYPGEIEAATAIERSKNGIPINDRLFDELQAMANRFGLDGPAQV